MVPKSRDEISYDSIHQSGSMTRQRLAVAESSEAENLRSMDPRQRLTQEWKTVETLVAMTCRRRGLSETDGEIVATMVMLKLFENDYAVVRSFRGERGAKFTTYLGRIISNTFADFCTERLGKWHPSAAAARMGPVALALERLVYRELWPPDEAIAHLQTAHPELTRSELWALFANLRFRPRPPSAVSLEALTGDVANDDQADDLLRAGELNRLEDRTAAVIRGFLATLPDNDRLMLQWTFESGMQIPKIARMLRIEDDKSLYRRREQLLRDLQKHLLAAGVTGADVRELFGHISEVADFGLRKKPNGPTEPEEGVTAHPEIPT